MLATSTVNRSEFKVLPLAGLIPDLLPPVDLYLPAETTAQVRLYRSADIPIKTSDIDTLRARGVNELLIVPEDYEQIKIVLGSQSRHAAQQRIPPAA